MNQRHLFSVIALNGFLTSIGLAQGTAFTYQGRLNSEGSPANGSYDFRFRLAADPLANTYVGSSFLTNGVAVTDGLFTVAMDFGPGVFNGSNYWLQVDVRTNNSGSYTTLNPLQPVTPAPYAIFAANVGSGGLAAGAYGSAVTFNNYANQFTGTFTGNGTGLTNVNAASFNGLPASSFWQTLGNAGTTPGPNFVGTTDNQPLEFHVNGLRGFRLEPAANTGFATNAVNVIGGSPANFAAAGMLGVTIAGGGAPYYFGSGTENRVWDNFGTIGGGVNNSICTNCFESTIAGGNANSIFPGGYRSTVAGGWGNIVETNANTSAIGGGQANVVASGWTVVGGGYANTNAGEVSVVGGGQYNLVDNGAVAATIGGGGAYGYPNHISSTLGAIAGGSGNTIQGSANDSTIGGGRQNEIDTNAWGAVIAGGHGNWIQAGLNPGGSYVNSSYSTIGGGYQNTIQINANGSFIGGGIFNAVGTNAAGNFIGGGFGNNIQTSAGYSAIAGGTENTIQTNANDSIVAGGYQNVIGSNNGGSTIAGGFQNQIQTFSAYGTISANTIAGGQNNLIQSNQVWATIGGGAYNTNNAFYSTVPGGYGNFAGGNYSFAAGNRAQALYSGDFIWADSQNTNFTATAPDQVGFRCRGGVVFTSGGSSADQTVSWTPGSAGWSFSSDRNLKERFEPVDCASVLDRVSQLPVVEWSYKGYAQRHIGAMAQDFHALFPLNSDDKTLNDADLHGVELVAIQALNHKIETGTQKSEVTIQKLEAENAALNRKNELLEKRLAALEKIVLSREAN